MKRPISFPWISLGAALVVSGMILSLTAVFFLLPLLACPWYCGKDLPGSRKMGPLATNLSTTLHDQGFTQHCPLCGSPILRLYWFRGLD